jgi:hypothetical protein
MQLGCGDDKYGHMGELGLGEVGCLGACPSDAQQVIVEDQPIPTWLLIVAGVWAALMLVKKR